MSPTFVLPMALFLLYDFLLVFDHVVFNSGMSFGMCAGHCVIAFIFGDINFLQKRLSFSHMQGKEGPIVLL